MPGPQGPQGPQGPKGDPGPGATQINVTEGTSTAVDPIATAGPWSLRFACFPGGPASVNITGPGSFYDTTVTGKPGTPFAAGSSPATTNVDNGPVGGGLTRANNPGAGQLQVSENVHLFSGTTMYELHLQLFGTTSSSPTCTLVGSILPVS